MGPFCRGEIHTIVDYCWHMLQDPAYTSNAIHTGWLDGRIAANVRADSPPWHLAVIAGAKGLKLFSPCASAAVTAIAQER